MASVLFSPLPLRGVTFRNRIGVSPMCQYSSEDGFATDWHLVHLGSRAVGGAALVIAEACAVEARGRISAEDLGIYHDEHVERLARITSFISAQGSVPGIQLAHAGRKASTAQPWKGGNPILPAAGGWVPVAPSAVPFSDEHATPDALSDRGIDDIVAVFVSGAKRALTAGFELIEIHAAHGYLLHEFLSPLSNQRADQYGGTLENRMRLTVRVAEEIRRVWPERYPLFVRISATDWHEGGWDIEQSVELARALKATGVDLVDCSSGGLVPRARISAGPGYQSPFASRIRRETGIATAAVGFITDPAQAEQIVRTGEADLVLLAREMLRDPYWPLRAAKRLGHRLPVPPQYDRAWD